VRLKSLTVSGFRGFPRLVEIDLDADAVIVYGANGSGKTSMFDAILWALTGSVQRLSDAPGDIVSEYSPSGEARVELEIRRDDSVMRVVRRFDGKQHLTVDDGRTQDDASNVASGSQAEAKLIDLLWPDARAATEPTEALSRSLTRAMYLQQDVVRQFVETDKEEDRFTVVSELVGVGRVSELLRQLESSRKTWSAATNSLAREIEPIRNQISALEGRLQRLGVGDTAPFEEEAFAEWVSEVSPFVSDRERSEIERRSADAVDRTLASLEVRQRQEERTATAFERLLRHLGTPAPEVVPSEPLRAQVHANEALVAQGSEQLRVAEEAAAGERRRQAELRDRAASVRTLAQLALQHLGERCPVCNQSYDQQATRTRLVELLGSDGNGEVVAALDAVPSAAAQLEELQRQLFAAQAALRTAERSEASRAQWDQTTASLTAECGIDVSPELATIAADRLTGIRSNVTDLQRLRRAGERFSLQLARVSEIAQRSEVESQVATVKADLALRELEWQSRLDTAELATSLINALRSATTKIVTDELSRIGPLLQRIYLSVDPHPSFRAVHFLTRAPRGRGRIWTAITDEAEGKTIEEPLRVLSSSQLNVLAVSTFLSLNLAIDTLPLQVVALDDPLQSLDSINLLGLADLLRRVRASRQVIISTHDSRLMDLLTRKLRPTANDRTRVVSLDAWNRSGPIVEQNDVPFDSPPLKLVAIA
jgi:exonuclease SbcC